MMGHKNAMTNEWKLKNWLKHWHAMHPHLFLIDLKIYILRILCIAQTMVCMTSMDLKSKIAMEVLNSLGKAHLLNHELFLDGHNSKIVHLLCTIEL